MVAVEQLGGSVEWNHRVRVGQLPNVYIYWLSQFIGTVFFTIAIRCSVLPAVDNGKITYSTDTTEPYDYGTTATYQCDSGYELTGGDTVRTCTGDGSSPVGEWNGTLPVCAGKGVIHTLILKDPLFLLNMHSYLS